MSRPVAVMAGIGSGLLLLGAFLFEYAGGLAPCKLCIWQRYPHGTGFALGMIALILPHLLIYVAGALSAAVTAAIGLYHVGVEQGWWEGPSSCSSGDISGLSAEELLEQILNAPMVRCDEIPWSLLGLSMAGWNAVISAVLCLIWIIAIWRELKES
ncbi:MAG: disulfide bond formation protein B [Pseudomonadota bacterium]